MERKKSWEIITEKGKKLRDGIHSLGKKYNLKAIGAKQLDLFTK